MVLLAGGMASGGNQLFLKCFEVAAGGLRFDLDEGFS